MVQNGYKRFKRWLYYLPLLFALLLAETSWSQAIIRVRVLNVQALNNNIDCDGFLSGDSDFVWEFVATDNTVGLNNNNPVFGGFLGDFNYVHNNGNNGAYTLTAPNGNYNPTSGQFFDHEYVCTSTVPTQINIDWRAYENDDVANYSLFFNLFTEGETGAQSAVIPVPAIPGSSGPQTFTAASTDAGCAQNYAITFEVERTALAVTAMPDNICDAFAMTLNSSVRFAWCPDCTLEVNEPHTSDVSANRSRWVSFVAPASGEVEVTTDLGGTDFGTYFQLYHAADGTGCTAGINAVTGALVKDKFEYLSHVEFADGTDALGIDPEAELSFTACDPVALFSYQKLHPGETYYVQITTDDANQQGYIEVSINDLGGGSPPDVEDIPCTSPNVAVGTAPISSGAGSAATTTLDFGCAFDGGNDQGETGSPHTNSDPENYHAYDYDQNASNNGTMNESVWVNFTAPNSGRMIMEADYQSGIFSENAAFFGLDDRFAPGVPADYSCANLTDDGGIEGGLNGLLGGQVESAIIERSCLEPGYDYYFMVDPSNNLTPLNSQSIDVWMYDPSVADPSNNAPGNDILCLALLDSLFEIPVQPFDSILPFAAVAGTNVRACIERLAGEPESDIDPLNRADQTVWHYFTAPASGAVDIRLRAYVGLNTLNYGVYELLNGSDCYGGLNPAAYTNDGTQATPQITAIAEGSTDFSGTTVSLCCLVPGNVYAIQLDGGAPNDEGQYIIEYIEEIETYAGDSQYETMMNDTITFQALDTAYICFGDTIIPSVMDDILGNSSTRIPGCLSVGYIMHTSFPTPDPVANVGFTFIDSAYLGPQVFVNNTDGSGSFSNPLFNQVYYVSALADETATWGQLTCPSASIENGAPVVFLRPITTTDSYDPNNCVITFSASGGVPQYDGSDFDYVVTNTAGDTVFMGQIGNNTPLSLGIPAADTYTIVITDGSGCSETIIINAAPCLDPCINNPVVVQPTPIDSTVYTCLPGDSATVTIQLTGGDPTVNGTDYVVIVSGSSASGVDGTYNVTPVGGANPTPFSFVVGDGDTWQVILEDVNACRDTVMHTFTYDLTNCPDFCNINPLVNSFEYECLPTGQAIINVTVGGGLPGQDGSDYLISTTGSTVFGQTFSNAQLPGVIGGTTSFSMIVNDGDVWDIIIMDGNMCSDTLTDTFVFGATDCSNICDLFPVEIDDIAYDCQPDGSAIVTVSVAGGIASYDGSNYAVTVSGSNAGGNVTNDPLAGVIGGSTTYSFSVQDGDAWTIMVMDIDSCADTLSSTFTYDPTNCPDICQLVPITAAFVDYDCTTGGLATVTVSIEGGRPSFDGTDYLVTVAGTSTGANIFNDPVAGVIGGTATYTFTVADGDNWSVIIRDSSGCEANVMGTFEWNATNCGNICSDPAYNPISINGGAGFTYDCDGAGGAIVTLTLEGGVPELNTSNDYIAAVTINGTTTTVQVSSGGTFGTLPISLSNGDTWSVDVYDGIGCDTASIANTIFNSVDAVATTDATTDLLVGQTATIDASQSSGTNLTYQWTPMTGANVDGGTDFTAVTTTVQPLETTTYTVLVTDNLGCTDMDSVEVLVGRCVPLHAGFTPNADGTNDLWTIPCLDLFNNTVEVYNRWGQLVYTKDNYDGTWDGTNNGQELPDAAYYYVITVTYPNLAEPIIYKGTVTIIR